MDKKLREKAKRWFEQDKIKFWLEILLNPNEKIDFYNLENEEDMPDYVIDYLIEESAKDDTIPPPAPERLKKLLDLVEKNKK